MPYKLAIFDFDGTLVDSAGWFINTLNDLAVRHKFRQVTDSEIEMLRGQGNREIIRHLGVSPWRLPFITADLRKRASADAATIKLFPGIEQMLVALHTHRVRSGVVSSSAEANVRRVLGSIADRANLLFDCEASLFGKTKKLRRLMKRAGTHPTETMYIGDEERDIEAAQAVGIASGAVLWGYAKRDLLVSKKPTIVFDRPADIIEAIVA